MQLGTNIRNSVRTCNDLPTVSAQLQGSVYTRLGQMKPAALAQDLRDALEKTEPGRVVEPFFSPAGLEVIMRCDTPAVKPVVFELPTREELEQQLFVQQMSVFAKLSARRTIPNLGPDSIIVRGSACYPVEISTGAYPSINSDMQPLFAIFGAMSRGESKIIDLRFPGRYLYAEQLRLMGLDCTIENNLLRIRGGKPLRGCEVRALDLRAGIALTLAGLVAEGRTVVSEAWQIERGYDRFVAKIQSLGGKVVPEWA